ncbi:MAG: membrane dipeptidase [Xanthobacteraceae bacterium]|nr:membrane dipeptidase [Xanthobacteraceae bacterium]MCW5673638.1 membrane dipeptidase [Xanthobacteraceae bacterium]
MNRREFVAGVLSAPFALQGRAFAQTPVFVGDMHVHSFFANSKYHLRPFAQSLAAGNATLVAWSLVGDLLWFDVKTYKQKSVPAAGETLGWFQRELGRIRAHLAEQRLKTIRTAADVDLALRGAPHIVLSVEGANFVENDPARVKLAYDAGIRQLQLVHYTGNSLGDIQTEAPQHRGLSETGKRVVAECNRLGMLIDLAHSSEATTRAALEVSRVPLVWSHGSVAKQLVPSTAIWRRRQLSLDLAKEIAKKGGVVGLWALAPDVGKTAESYADRVLELAEWLGEDHVAFGTDINGLGLYASLSNYGDLKGVVEHWQRQGVPEAKIRKLAIGNFARVLKTALDARV